MYHHFPNTSCLLEDPPFEGKPFLLSSGNSLHNCRSHGPFVDSLPIQISQNGDCPVRKLLVMTVIDPNKPKQLLLPFNHVAMFLSRYPQHFRYRQAAASHEPV